MVKSVEKDRKTAFSCGFDRIVQSRKNLPFKLMDFN